MLLRLIKCCFITIIIIIIIIIIASCSEEGVKISFTAPLVSGYAHVFILLSSVIVTLQSSCMHLCVQMTLADTALLIHHTLVSADESESHQFSCSTTRKSSRQRRPGSELRSGECCHGDCHGNRCYDQLFSYAIIIIITAVINDILLYL